MADIFGKTPDDYRFRRDSARGKERSNATRPACQSARMPAAHPRHDFNALGSGVPKEYHRAADDAQALGFLTNNLLAIQAAVDEVLYNAYRLPMFVHLNTGVPEGADTYGVRIPQSRRARASGGRAGMGCSERDGQRDDRAAEAPRIRLGCRVEHQRAARRDASAGGRSTRRRSTPP